MPMFFELLNWSILVSKTLKKVYVGLAKKLILLSKFNYAMTSIFFANAMFIIFLSQFSQVRVTYMYVATEVNYVPVCRIYDEVS